MQIGEGERFVDLLREGVDCVIRAGDLPDSALVARRLGAMAEVTCASPAYLARHGVLASPDDLGGHVMVGFVSSRSGQVMPLEFTVAETTVERRLPARVLVGVAAARLGLGLIQAPRQGLADDLARGALVEVLADVPPSPTPVSILYPGGRQLAPRVRFCIDWLVAVLGPQLRGIEMERVPLDADADQLSTVGRSLAKDLA